MSVSRGVGAVGSVLVYLCVLTACTRGDDNPRADQQPAVTGTPTSVGLPITATPPGILGPPQTAVASSPPLDRQRAEALLRRIAPTTADLPPSLAAQPPAYRTAGEVQPGDPFPPDPAAAGRPGLVLLYRSAFEIAPGADTAERDIVISVEHTGLVFDSPDAARAHLAHLAATLSPVLYGRAGNRAQQLAVEPLTGLQLGEESHAWRASGPGTASHFGDRQLSVVGVAVRRGSVTTLLVVDGAGNAPETLARALAARLDQRLAAAP